MDNFNLLTLQLESQHDVFWNYSEPWRFSFSIWDLTNNLTRLENSITTSTFRKFVIRSNPGQVKFLKKNESPAVNPTLFFSFLMCGIISVALPGAWLHINRVDSVMIKFNYLPSTQQQQTNGRFWPAALEKEAAKKKKKKKKPTWLLVNHVMSIFFVGCHKVCQPWTNTVTCWTWKSLLNVLGFTHSCWVGLIEKQMGPCRNVWRAPPDAHCAMHNRIKSSS